LSEASSDRPGASPDPRLGAIVGRWRSEGHLAADPTVAITGTDIYEWLPGGYFLVHHVDVTVGDQPVQAIEIIGERDPDSDAFLARSYDNTGSTEIMRVRIDDDGVWRFTGGADVAPAAQPDDRSASGGTRSTLTVSADTESMTALWERTDDGSTWELWMHMTFTRTP
jgi:hypothetical protein